MEDEGRPIRNYFQTVHLIAMELMLRFLEQVTLTRTEVLQTINVNFVQDRFQSNEIVVMGPGGPFL